MSYSKSSKLVRTESILDERKTYFSYVLSPFRKKKTHNNVERNSAGPNPQQHQHYQQRPYQQHQPYHYYQQHQLHQPHNYQQHRYQPLQQQQQQRNGNIDAEAENFIKKKHQKFESSYLKPNYYY